MAKKGGIILFLLYHLILKILKFIKFVIMALYIIDVNIAFIQRLKRLIINFLKLEAT